MAEATGSAPTNPPTSPTTSGKVKQYIKAQNNDEELQPDALRGNEDIIKQLGIEDEDAEKRKAYEQK